MSCCLRVLPHTSKRAQVRVLPPERRGGGGLEGTVGTACQMVREEQMLGLIKLGNLISPLPPSAVFLFLLKFVKSYLIQYD